MTSKVVAGGDSLAFQRTRRVPSALTGQENVQQVVLKIYVACESLVVLAEKERIGEREEIERRNTARRD
jgi:hypothetical protein